MSLTFKTFTKLPKEAKAIRTSVFVIEQGFNEEFDISDNEAIHVLMYLDDKAIGNSRIIYQAKHNSITIGRFAILKKYRNKGYGKLLLEYTEKVIIDKYGHIKIGLGAQDRAKYFYHKLGYSFTDETYLDENYPHVWMEKEL